MDGGWLERLAKAVEADGRSPRAISLSAGLGPNYLREVLTEGKEPGAAKLIRICAELGVSAASLFGGAPMTADAEEALRVFDQLPEDQQKTILSLMRSLPKAER